MSLLWGLLVLDAQSPIGKFLAFCSLATAGCFGVSALANGAFFWISWKISYFRIANPGDVVMGGFALLVHFLWIFLAASLFVSLCRSAAQQGVAMLGVLDQRRLSIREFMAEAAEEHRFGFWMAVFISLFLALPVALWGRAAWDQSIWALLKEPIEQPVIYRTGLRVAAESTPISGCSKADILWMGSSSAVLKCEQGMRVIHKLDALVTEPVGDATQ